MVTKSSVNFNLYRWMQGQGFCENNFWGTGNFLTNRNVLVVHRKIQELLNHTANL